MVANIFGGRILRALVRARLGIATIFLTYVLSITIGIVMVNSGNNLALRTRDNLIAKASASDPSLIALQKGNRVGAALSDFSSNLIAGVSNTAGGLGVVFPYPLVAYRGWIGGIVSVDDNHVSRLADPNEAFYYLLTLLLQIIPYSLAGGMGVNLGLSLWRLPTYYQGEKWLGMPKEALWDVLRVYILIVPLFLGASFWEFLAR
jgi:hypothetical protein